MKNIIPELVILLSSFSLLITGVFSKTFNKIINYIVIVLLAALILVVYLNFVGSDTLFGNSYTIDPLSNFMKILVLISVLFTMLISNTYLERLKIAKFEYPIILLLSTLGMFVMISANNLIVFYLGLELQSLCLYVLAAINTKSLKSSEAGLKYFVLGSLSSGLLLYGCSLVYGFTGSVDYSEIAKVATEQSGALKFGLVFILCGIAFKISAVPFHMWAPDVYEGSPTSVTTFFAMAPKVAAIAALIKFLNVPYANFINEWRTIVIVLSIASMFLGAVAAIGQSNLKRLMAYSSIGHIGFILAGLAIATPQSLSAVLVYIVIYVFMNIGVFACIMSLNRNGVYFENISDLSGLSKHHPLIAICLTILTCSLAGIPPLAGFFSKDQILASAFENNMLIFVLGSLVSSMTAFYMFRLYFLTFHGKFRGTHDQEHHLHESPKVMTIPLVVLAIASTVGGFLGFPHELGHSMHVTHWLDHFLEDTVVMSMGSMHLSTEIVLMLVATVVALVSFYYAWLKYKKNGELALEDKQIKSSTHLTLVNKYYIDELYDTIIRKPLDAISSFFSSIFEHQIVDGLVRQVSHIPAGLGSALKLVQNGKVAVYILMMIIGLIAILFTLM